MVAHPDASLAAAARGLLRRATDRGDAGRRQPTTGRCSYSTPNGEYLAGYAPRAAVGAGRWSSSSRRPRRLPCAAGPRAGLRRSCSRHRPGDRRGRWPPGWAGRPAERAGARRGQRFAGNPAAPLPRSRVAKSRGWPRPSARCGTPGGPHGRARAGRGGARASEERYRDRRNRAGRDLDPDDQNRTAFANRKMADMLGYRSTSWSGAAGRLPGRVATKRSPAAEATAAPGAGGAPRHVLRRKDGTTRWAIVATNPLFDRQAVHGPLGMVTDITDASTPRTAGHSSPGARHAARLEERTGSSRGPPRRRSSSWPP